MMLAIPKNIVLDLIRKGQIPIVLETFDNRICCRRARRDQSPVGCVNLKRNSDGSTWCALNGAVRASVCVFDEPESSRAWQRIREQQALALEVERG